jgi:hypothetical protein
VSFDLVLKKNSFLKQSKKVIEGATRVVLVTAVVVLSVSSNGSHIMPL